MPGQTWPRAPGLPITDGIRSFVSRDAVVLEGEVVLSLADGRYVGEASNHVIVPLLDALGDRVDSVERLADSKGERRWSSLLVAADAATPYSTLFALLHTADRAGVDELALVVDAAPDGVAQLPVTLSRSSSRHAGPKSAMAEIAQAHDPDFAPPAMTVELTSERASLTPGRHAEVAPAELANTDVVAITHYAEALQREQLEFRRVVISADPSVPLQTLVGVIAAARGPECDASGERCLLPEVVLLVDDAHAYPSDPYER